MSGRARHVAAFVRARRAAWERLEALSARVDGGRLSLAEAEELDRLYRRTAGDLAYARTAFPGSDAEGYLAQVAARASGALHRRRQRPLAALARVLGAEAPAAMARHAGALALAWGALAAGVAAGAAAVATSPEGAAWLVPAGVREAIEAGRLWTGDLLSVAPGVAGGAVARNNLAVAALAVALGLSGGIGTAALLFANGVVVGAVAAATARAGLGAGFLAFLGAHGPVELSALALAGQAGFVLAGGLVAPGEWPRREALAAAGREAGRLLAVVVPALLVVALVEATVSPSSLPGAARWGLGLALAAALWGYLARGGRGATGTGAGVGAGASTARSRTMGAGA